MALVQWSTVFLVRDFVAVKPCRSCNDTGKIRVPLDGAKNGSWKFCLLRLFFEERSVKPLLEWREEGG